MKKQERDVTHKELENKSSWEPMTLIPVGNLGAVIQDMAGSFLDGGGGGAMMSMA